MKSGKGKSKGIYDGAAPEVEEKLLTPHYVTLGRYLALSEPRFPQQKGRERGLGWVSEWDAHRRWESRASTASSSRMSTRMRESVRMRGSKSGEPVRGQGGGPAHRGVLSSPSYAPA